MTNPRRHRPGCRSSTGAMRNATPSATSNPRFQVDRPAGDHEHRENGQGDHQPRARPTGSTRPEVCGQCQKHPDPHEKREIDQRDQPNEVPGHQVKSLRRAECSMNDPGGDLELAPGEPAPHRKDQQIHRAKATDAVCRWREALRADVGHRMSSRGKRGATVPTCDRTIPAGVLPFRTGWSPSRIAGDVAGTGADFRVEPVSRADQTSLDCSDAIPAADEFRVHGRKRDQFLKCAFTIEEREVSSQRDAMSDFSDKTAFRGGRIDYPCSQDRSPDPSPSE